MFPQRPEAHEIQKIPPTPIPPRSKLGSFGPVAVHEAPAWEQGKTEAEKQRRWEKKKLTDVEIWTDVC